MQLSTESSNVLILVGQQLIDPQLHAPTLPQHVAQLMQDVTSAIKRIESHRLHNFMDEQDISRAFNTFVKDDIVCKYLSSLRYRRGTIYYFLQISSLDGGNARIIGYSTSTVFHSAASFGTTPDAKLVQNELKNLLEQSTNLVLTELRSIKLVHPTIASAEELLKSIKY
jgi:hypothetical protein